MKPDFHETKRFLNYASKNIPPEVIIFELK